MLSQSDISQFKYYEELCNETKTSSSNTTWNMHTPQGLDDAFGVGGPIDSEMRSRDLYKYEEAYHLTAEHLKSKIDFNNSNHQRILSLCLEAQKDPSHWKQLDEDNQRQLKKILTTQHQLNLEKSQNIIHLNRAEKIGISNTPNLLKNPILKIADFCNVSNHTI